jgi:hemerythrin
MQLSLNVQANNVGCAPWRNSQSIYPVLTERKIWYYQESVGGILCFPGVKVTLNRQLGKEQAMAVEWNTYLSVGVERIDEQHKEIFRQVNGFIEAINQGNGTTQVLEVLTFLTNYTVTHFHDEEAIMEESDYPLLESHKMEHGKFCQDVLALTNQITVKGVNKVNVLQTSHTMVNWLIQHIMNTDKALADHMRSLRW